MIQEPPILPIERELLGACLFDPVAADRAVAIVEPRDFLDPTHREVFAAIQRLALARECPNPASVSAALAGRVLASEIHGYELLVTSSAYATVHSKTILAASKQRRIAQLASELVGLTSGSSVTPDAADAALEHAQNVVAELTNRVAGKQSIHLCDAEPDLMVRLRNRMPTPRGWSTGFETLDAAFGGLRDGELIVFGARPSVGKSLFGAIVGEFVALNPDDPHPVLFLSLEMSGSAIYRRFLFGRSGIRAETALSGNVDQDEMDAIEQAHRAAKGANWHVHAESSLSIARAHALARRFQARFGKPLIVVDYLQLMTAPGSSRVESITNVSAGLKNIAGDLECPVIALAQLNRAVDRTGSAPMLSDLRDSGSIEQDADVILFGSRDTMQRERHPMDVIVAKNRPGKTGRIQLMFDPVGPRIRDFPRVEQFS